MCCPTLKYTVQQLIVYPMDLWTGHNKIVLPSWSYTDLHSANEVKDGLPIKANWRLMVGKSCSRTRLTFHSTIIPGVTNLFNAPKLSFSHRVFEYQLFQQVWQGSMGQAGTNFLRRWQ